MIWHPDDITDPHELAGDDPYYLGTTAVEGQCLATKKNWEADKFVEITSVMKCQN